MNKTGNDTIRAIGAWVTRGATVGVRTERKVKSERTLSAAELCEVISNRRDIAITAEELYAIFDTIGEVQREGSEVNIEDRCRFYACLDREQDRMEVVAQTTGSLRSAISDLEFKFVNCGKEVSKKTLEAKAKRCRAERDEVTPDIEVSCPACGHKFRVGKSLRRLPNDK